MSPSPNKTIYFKTTIKIPIFLVFTPLFTCRHQVLAQVGRHQPHNPQRLLRKTAVESVIAIQITLITFNHLYIQIIIMPHKRQAPLYHHRMYNQIFVCRRRVIAIGQITQVKVARKTRMREWPQIKQAFPRRNIHHLRLRQHLIVSQRMTKTKQSATQRRDTIKYFHKRILSHHSCYRTSSRNYKRCGCCK